MVKYYAQPKKLAIEYPFAAGSHPDSHAKEGADMTDKEFKRLTRPQLIDIIYQLQLKEEALISENQKLNEELENKRIRMSQVGNIAEAALEINNVMRSAQSAAEQYLEEIRHMRAEAEEACRKMLDDAKKEAAEILAQAAANCSPNNAASDAIGETDT